MESSRGYHWFFDGASARLLGRVVGVVAAAVLVPTMAQAAPPQVEVVTAAVKPKPVTSAADAVSAAVSARRRVPGLRLKNCGMSSRRRG